MFLKGVNHEKLGEMTTVSKLVISLKKNDNSVNSNYFQAIKCYKTALRLDPDIEKRIYEEKLNEGMKTGWLKYGLNCNSV